jgi:hypothetical protein
MTLSRGGLILGSCVVGLCFTLPSQANDKFLVQMPAVYEPDAPVTPAVKRECAVESLIGNHVFNSVYGRYPGSIQTGTPGEDNSDKYLKLGILSVHGVGGGAWSGGKSVTIRASVMQHAKVVSTRVLTRGSRGGPFGGMSGTCAIIERIAVALGRDIVGWLQTVSFHNPETPPKEAAQRTLDPEAPMGDSPSAKPDEQRVSP